MVVLGVGKNMVSSIRHWCETLGLAEPIGRTGRARPTRLGLALFDPDGGDPYLEDQGTLWLLHWLLVSRRDRASTWYLAFTRWNADLFTRDHLVDWLRKLVADVPGVRATPVSLGRDVEVFLRTYIPSRVTHTFPLEDSFDCPLVELGLLREVERGWYQFVRGPKPALPDEIFVYALLDFWRRTAPRQRTLSFETVLHPPGSPGAAFKLSENALAERLEHLPRWSRLVYDETAGMRVILRQERAAEADPFWVLDRYYYLADIAPQGMPA